LNPDVRAQIDATRPQLAAAHNLDPTIQGAITESFLRGYRTVFWIAIGVAALSAVTAGLLIESGVPTTAKRV
jgi:hypothetical protein